MVINASLKPTKKIYGGLFLTSLATIMLELLLTRIFSVTMWYHFAFMAISIAMFGLTIGAMAVYLFPPFFILEKIEERLTLSAVLFSLSIIVSFFIFLHIPIYATLSIKNFIFLSVIYILIAIPFVFSGIIISFCLTKFPFYVNSLYAADLIGAAIGGLSLVIILNFTNGPTGIFFIAFLAAVCAIIFSSLEKTRMISVYACFFVLILTALNTMSNIMGEPVFGLRWVKGNRDIPALYEKWNSFSRIIVFGNPDILQYPYAWGLSPSFLDKQKYRYLELQIDGGAITPLLNYRHNNEDISFLKYDISSIGYYAKPNHSVLIIGSGGGRDVLTALLFNAKSVVGIDINKNTLNAVNTIFGDFTGHLDQDPRVTFVHDEARSYMTQLHQSFDFIQISLIDTWAATASGAFVFSENSLYTTEAWKIFFNHLTDHGILSVSRWYTPEKPAEIYRLLSLTKQSLTQMGVSDVASHVILIQEFAL